MLKRLTKNLLLKNKYFFDNCKDMNFFLKKYKKCGRKLPCF
ncbi:hypothetical protein AC062_2023 [Pasteurellaceae bacterium NI1060]|nr:hypothetical protein AC062_2023 [Pasteurellaceae bacterium NI1060]